MLVEAVTAQSAATANARSLIVASEVYGPPTGPLLAWSVIRM
jgi:hypothetical protein